MSPENLELKRVLAKKVPIDTDTHIADIDTDLYKLTGGVRYIRRQKMVRATYGSGLVKSFETVLQQKFINLGGDRIEWRDVPTVDEENVNNKVVH